MAKRSNASRRALKRKNPEHALKRPAPRAASQPGVALNPFEPVERLAKAFMPFGWLMPWLDVRVPRMDVIEREREVVVKAEVPGVEKDALNVEVGDHSVTIEGALHQEASERQASYVRSEISRGAFSRTVMLPASVDGSKARADFKDGMLVVTLPKLNASRRDTVKVGRVD